MLAAQVEQQSLVRVVEAVEHHASFTASAYDASGQEQS
jgi:hypothetical protein